MQIHNGMSEIDFTVTPTIIDGRVIDMVRPFLLKIGSLGSLHLTPEEALELQYLVTSAIDTREVEKHGSVPATPFYKRVKAKVFPIGVEEGCFKCLGKFTTDSRFIDAEEWQWGHNCEVQ